MDTTFDTRIITLWNKTKKPFDIIYDNKIWRTIPSNHAARIPLKPFGELAKKHLIDALCNENGQPTNDAQIRAKWEAEIILDRDSDNSTEVLTPEEVMKRQFDKLNGDNASETIKECPECHTKVFNLAEHNILNHNVPQDPTAQETAQETVQAAPAPQAPVEPPAPVNPQATEQAPVIDNGSEMPVPVAKPLPQTPQQKEMAHIIQGAVSNQGAQVLPEQKEEENPAPAPVEPAKPNPTREELITYARDELYMNVNDPKTKQFLDTAPLEDLVKELRYGI